MGGPGSGAASARIHPASAWTGTELLIWGGLTRESSGELGDGAAYNPTEGTWRALPAAPISPRAPLAVWTGEEFLVWGTAVRTGAAPRDGAAYHPASNTWRPIPDAPLALSDAVASWTGRELIVFGASLSLANNAPATSTAVGAAYDPSTAFWRRLPDSPLSPQACTAAWNGQELVAWDYEGTTAAYEPNRDAWRSLARVPIDPGECRPHSVPLGHHTFSESCGQMAVHDGRSGRWRSVTRADFAAWAFVLVEAGSAVLLLGTNLHTGQRAMVAFRP